MWARTVDYVYAVNVTARYAAPAGPQTRPAAPKAPAGFDVEASMHAVDQLKKHLTAPPDKRAPLGEQDFATVALTRADDAEARRLLWPDHVARIKRTRIAEMKASKLKAGDAVMPFYCSVTGKPPAGGRSLYISLHGGGGAPKRVNDGQWENQKRLYRVPEGLYLAPRAPTDAWNMWHKGHIDVLLDRLIEDMVAMAGVNPNRVYVLGYSAGGDGVYRLGPRMADRWAAAAMMAGHPGDASPVNLRNTPFTIHVGANDGAYKRNAVARQWGDKLDALQKADPEGYVHWTKIYKGKGHWLDRQDAAAIPWMAKHTRNPLPRRIVWRQDSHTRFYWLAVKTSQPGAVVRADLTDQRIDVQLGEAKGLLVRVNDKMLDLDKPLTVTSGGKIVFHGRATRTIATLAQTLAERGDPTSIFSAEITVAPPVKAK